MLAKLPKDCTNQIVRRAAAAAADCVDLEKKPFNRQMLFLEGWFEGVKARQHKQHFICDEYFFLSEPKSLFA